MKGFRYASQFENDIFKVYNMFGDLRKMYPRKFKPRHILNFKCFDLFSKKLINVGPIWGIVLNICGTFRNTCFT